MKRPRRSPTNDSTSCVEMGAAPQPSQQSSLPSWRGGATAAAVESEPSTASFSAWTRTTALLFRRHSHQQQQQQQHRNGNIGSSASFYMNASTPRASPVRSSSSDGLYFQRPPLSASSSSSSNTTSSSAAAANISVPRTPSSDSLFWRNGSSSVARKRSSPRSNSVTADSPAASAAAAAMTLGATSDHGKTFTSTTPRSQNHNHENGAALVYTSSTTPHSGPLLMTGNGSGHVHRPRSFRRQKRAARRRGFCNVLQSRQSIRLLLAWIAALFALSFIVTFGISHPSLLAMEFVSSSSTPLQPLEADDALTRQLHPSGKMWTPWMPFSLTPRFTAASSSMNASTAQNPHAVTPMTTPRLRVATTAAVSDKSQGQEPTMAMKNKLKPQSTSKLLRGGGDQSTITNYNFQRYSKVAPNCQALSHAKDVDFTLVTQLSLNRLWMMEHHCARWQHAISIAVHTASKKPTSPPPSADALFHLLVHEKKWCTEQQLVVQTLDKYSEEEYPVNVLRNMALAAVRTSHVVYVDVDFWPSSGLYEQLQQQHAPTLAADPALALVMPAFALKRQCTEYSDCRDQNVPRMPQTRHDLIDLIVDHQASAFDPSNIGGHGSTRYKEWLGQEDHELLPIECIKSNRYEPYLVVRYCHDLPPFQEAFTGYGKNKMTWMMQFRRTGYRLMQLGGDGSFVVHYPHLDSTARLHWNGGANGAQLPKPNVASHTASQSQQHAAVDWTAYKRGQIDQTFVAFRHWLEETIPDTSVVPMCPDALDDDSRLWIDRNK